MVQIDQDKYNKFFRDEKKKVEAFKIALDNRKFEIEMYWKRAAYFWTLIGASLLGYFTVVTSEKFKVTERSGEAAFAISCIGIVFSWSWFLANKGSKKWQENWENQIELLENDICGPLYKTVLARHDVDKSFFGPDTYSVSTINVITSFFVFVVWIVLAAYVSGLSNASYKPDFHKIGFFFVSLMFCLVIHDKGKSHGGDHHPRADVRITKIV